VSGLRIDAELIRSTPLNEIIVLLDIYKGTWEQLFIEGLLSDLEL